MGKKKKYAKPQKNNYTLWYVAIGVLVFLATVCIMVLILFALHGNDREEAVQVTQSTKATTELKSKTAERPTETTVVDEPTTATATTEEEEFYLKNLDDKEAGDVIDEEEIDDSRLEQYFTSSPISEKISKRIDGLSYKKGAVIPKSDLRYLKLLHYNFDQEIQVGELIVHAKLAEEMLEIFQELYEEEYEIEKMYLVDKYGADDTTSIDDNNTSAFNYRAVTGGSSLSKHALGCAIDINPQQNPYVTFNSNGSAHWVHSNANDYIDRNGSGDHMIDHNDLCYRIFNEHGFTWGGDWNNPKDYQHFQKQVANY